MSKSCKIIILIIKKWKISMDKIKVTLYYLWIEYKVGDARTVHLKEIIRAHQTQMKNILLK